MIIMITVIINIIMITKAWIIIKIIIMLWLFRALEELSLISGMHADQIVGSMKGKKFTRTVPSHTISIKMNLSKNIVIIFNEG